MIRCQNLAGLTFLQLASLLKQPLPHQPAQRKGWVGQALERVLGADAKNQASPDFSVLGIELKTLPIGPHGKPAESTFVTSIPLLTIHQQTWSNSQCFAKLRRVLWLSIEDDDTIPFAHRRLGQGIIWSPSPQQETILADDWCELTSMISLGQLSKIDAKIGQYLQVRPKARDGKSLCYGFDEQGNKILTLPRGFYLRSSFTASIL